MEVDQSPEAYLSCDKPAIKLLQVSVILGTERRGLSSREVGARKEVSRRQCCVVQPQGREAVTRGGEQERERHSKQRITTNTQESHNPGNLRRPVIAGE